MCSVEEGLASFCRWPPLSERLHRASSLDDSHQDGNNRQNEQNVNESPKGVRTDHPEEPENQQNDSDGPQHVSVPFRVYTPDERR
jgi:hypothetical protein